MAVTLTVDQLAIALIGNLTTLGVAQASSEAWAEAEAARLLPVVTEMVDRHAITAPEAISNEAAIRCAGWLANEPPDSRQTDSFNILGVQTTITHTPAWLVHCGHPGRWHCWRHTNADTLAASQEGRRRHEVALAQRRQGGSPAVRRRIPRRRGAGNRTGSDYGSRRRQLIRRARGCQRQSVQGVYERND